MTPESLLRDLLLKEAERQNLPCVDDLPAARVSKSAARSLLTQLEAAGTPPSADISEDTSLELPRQFAALAIGGFPVLIGAFGASEARDAVNAVWGQFNNLVASTRTRLQGNQSCDLHLLLIAPPGSEKKDFWLEVRGEVEHNDLLCRKLVWLPPEDPASWQGSAMEFLGRTFLAQPWVGGAVGAHELDQLDDAVSRLAAQVDLSTEILRSWVALLERKDLESPALVAMLVDTLARREEFTTASP